LVVVAVRRSHTGLRKPPSGAAVGPDPGFVVTNPAFKGEDMSLDTVDSGRGGETLI
jgi:hypothetical protein